MQEIRLEKAKTDCQTLDFLLYCNRVVEEFVFAEQYGGYEWKIIGKND